MKNHIVKKKISIQESVTYSYLKLYQWFYSLNEKHIKIFLFIYYQENIFIQILSVPPSPFNRVQWSGSSILSLVIQSQESSSSTNFGILS